MPNTITVKSGQSLSQIAAANKVSVAELCKANNISNPDEIKAGQKITIPTGDSSDIKRTPAQQESLAVVNKAKEYGHGEKYKFQVDEKGNFVITLKEEVQIGRIINDLGIPSGDLRELNPKFIENAKKPFLSVNSNEDVYNDNNKIAQEGSKFFIFKGGLNPKDPNDNTWNKIMSLIFD